MGLIMQPYKELCLFCGRIVFLLYFVYPINEKNKPSFSMPDGMLVGSAIFLARGGLGMNNNMQIFFKLNEFLLKIIYI